MGQNVETGESPEHKAIVAAMMRYLNQEGFQTICEALDDFKKCEPIDEKIADFMGKDTQGPWCIGEAKICDDMVNDRERTNEQFRAFASGKARFYICVPKACVEQLNQF